jgi:Amt family ammonium transporter
MWMTTLSALLLPLGIWLLLSAATPKADENRVAVSGLVTALAASLAFAVTGFAFMADQGIGVTISSQSWQVLGASGFAMSDDPSLTRFFVQLALACACALLATSPFARRTSFWMQAIVGAVVAGALFPVAGKWVLSNGWLAALGRHLNFGHGAVDFGGLATVGLVSGGTGLALLWVAPRRNATSTKTLPISHFPFRAISGAVCVLMGSAIVFGSNPLLGTMAEKVTLSYLVNLGLACFVGAVGGLLYSKVTSPTADVLCACRAMLAAAIMVSSGAGALPVWVAASLGIVAGLLATVGLYVVQEKLRLDDEAALIPSTLLPGIIGFLVTGLFANGSLGTGWNGVGEQRYLAVSQMGVVGLLPVATTVGDAGQLTAQLVAVISVGAFSLVGAGVMGYVLRAQLRAPVFSPVAVADAVAVAAEPATELGPSLVPARLIDIQPIQPIAVAPTPMLAPEPTRVAIEPPPVKEPEVLPIPKPEPPRVVVTPVDTPHKQQPQDGLLDRLRRVRRANLPERPARARKVAYPTRVSGKRLIRPLVDEASTKSP